MTSETLTRSSNICKVLIGHSYKEESDFRPTPKLKDGQFVIGRMIYLCKQVKGQKQKSAREASQLVASELRKDWINKNVYPLREWHVSKKIMDDYKKFKILCKKEGNKKRPKTDYWVKNVKQFNQDMTKNAYDIKTKHKMYQKKLEDENGVKMTDEDEAFYTENCMESYKATCSATVSTSWMKKKKYEQSRNESAEMKESERQETCANKLQFQEALKPISDSWSMDSDSDFEAPFCSIHFPLPVNTRSTPLKTFLTN